MDERVETHIGDMMHAEIANFRRWHGIPGNNAHKGYELAAIPMVDDKGHIAQAARAAPQVHLVSCSRGCVQPATGNTTHNKGWKHTSDAVY